MKNKDINDLRNKSTAELDKLVTDWTGQITKALMDLATRKVKNTNLVSNLKHDLARLLSIKREKELYVSH